MYGNKKKRRWPNSHILRRSLTKLKYKIEVISCHPHISTLFKVYGDVTALLLPIFVPRKYIILFEYFVHQLYFFFKISKSLILWFEFGSGLSQKVFCELRFNVRVSDELEQTI